jgi:hypothetical protein
MTAMVKGVGRGKSLEPGEATYPKSTMGEEE